MHRDQLLSELSFKAVRSSGAGGQHVNKTSSKVILSWSFEDSLGITTSEKDRLREKLKNRLTTEGVLQLSASQSRSQHKNKAAVIARFLDTIEEALKKRKKRKKTKIPKKAHLKRLDSKKRQAQRKKLRKPPKA